MLNKVRIQKKQITHCQKGSKKSKQIFIMINPTKRIQMDTSISNSYRPFSNLALCPKQVIAFVQGTTFDFQELENTVQNLKMPSNMKRIDTLNKMKKLADRQEDFKNLLLQNSCTFIINIFNQVMRIILINSL